MRFGSCCNFDVAHSTQDMLTQRNINTDMTTIHSRLSKIDTDMTSLSILRPRPAVSHACKQIRTLLKGPGSFPNLARRKHRVRGTSSRVTANKLTSMHPSTVVFTANLLWKGFGMVNPRMGTIVVCKKRSRKAKHGREGGKIIRLL